MDWLTPFIANKDVMDLIGRIIPNEFSKLNSFSKFTGPVAPILQGVAAIDNYATATGDGAGIGTALKSGATGAFGGSMDPGVYGSPGAPRNNDIWNTLGMIGNLTSPMTGWAGMFDPQMAGDIQKGLELGAMLFPDLFKKPNAKKPKKIPTPIPNAALRNPSQYIQPIPSTFPFTDRPYTLIPI